MFLVLKKWYGIAKKRCELAFYRRKIIDMYGGKSDVEIIDEEYREIVDFLKKNRARVLNYSFVDEIGKKKIEILKDAKEGMMYVYHNGKIMYFPREWSVQKIEKYYRSILEEQHKESPHCYLTSELIDRDYETIVDVGGAEGVFTLDMMDHAKKIYIFEAESYWQEALEKTFRPFREKVVVIPKYVSSKYDNKHTTLDHELMGEKIDLIKMDVEGEEIDVLKGARSICEENKDIRLLICVYHYAEQYEEVKNCLKEYEIKERHGYLLYHWGNDWLKSPYLRRGVIEAVHRGVEKRS